VLYIATHVDQADAIFVAGEFCFPFLSLRNNVTLKRHAQLAAEYIIPCREIVRKARVLGVRVVMPIDLMVGDEAPGAEDRLKCFEDVDVDGRDEGGEYNGEAKLALLYTPPPAPPVAVEPVSTEPATPHRGKGKVAKATAPSPVIAPATPPPPPMPSVQEYVVEDFVLDIGPKSSEELRREVSESDVVLSWGTIGVCELGPFQSGQKALVQSAARRLRGDRRSSSDLSPLVRKPCQTVVMGDSAVEWFSRIADPDGEHAGDLLGARMVSYMTRDSALLSGLIGGALSKSMSEFVHRDMNSNELEWTFERPLPKEADEEDEDDDAEEDDD